MAQTKTTTTELPSKSSQPAFLSLNIPPYEENSALSPQAQSAPPKSNPRRIFSDPITPSLPFSQPSRLIDKRSTNPTSPSSVRNVRFGGSGGEVTKMKSIDPPRRRHSSEARMNVHTECGRHSDDWLFGGFSVAGMKSLLRGMKGGRGREKEGKNVDGDERGGLR